MKRDDDDDDDEVDDDTIARMLFPSSNKSSFQLDVQFDTRIRECRCGTSHTATSTLRSYTTLSYCTPSHWTRRWPRDWTSAVSRWTDRRLRCKECIVMIRDWTIAAESLLLNKWATDCSQVGDVRDGVFTFCYIFNFVFITNVLYVFTARRVCIVRTTPRQDVCPSVRLTVCLSICHTPVFCLNGYTLSSTFFSPSGSLTILVFKRLTLR